MTRRPNLNYANVVPEGTFIATYMKRMQVQETSLAYDFWCAVWVLSVVLGRRVTVPRPRAPVYLNWYTMLVAESGVTRKSSAVRQATNLVREYRSRHPEHNITSIETRTTPEMLESTLHKLSNEHGYAHVAISVSELVTFLGKEKYTTQMPGLLTDLYDSPSHRIGGGTIGRGTTEIRNVFVNFLSATTPSWLMRAINPDVVEGGFTSRCIFVHAEKRKKRIAWPDDTVDTNTEDMLLNRLDSIDQVANDCPEIRLSTKARTRYENWYNTRRESRTPFLSSFESREDSHILRLAAILAVNEDLWVIQSRQITKAIQIIAQVKHDGSQIFAGGLHSDRLVIAIDRLRDRLIERGMRGATQSELSLYARNFANAPTVRTILSIMHELDMVQQFENVMQGVGRPTTIWRATNLITANSAMDALYRRMKPDEQ